MFGENLYECWWSGQCDQEYVWYSKVDYAHVAVGTEGGGGEDGDNHENISKQTDEGQERVDHDEQDGEPS